MVEDSTGPISGFIKIGDVGVHQKPRFHGEILVELPGPSSSPVCVIDSDSKISGYVCVSGLDRITGRIYIQRVGPTWGEPTNVRELGFNVLSITFDSLRMLRAFDEAVYRISGSIPNTVMQSPIGRMARFIRERIGFYKPTLLNDRGAKLEDIKMIQGEYKVRENKHETRHTSKLKHAEWYRRYEGVLVDQTSPEQREIEAEKMLEKAEKALESMSV